MTRTGPFDPRRAVSLDDYGEQQFTSLSDTGSEIEGKKFTKEALEIARMVDQVNGDNVKTFKNSEVVFVTYASANHFHESREAIYRLRLQTNATLIYYDLGLTREFRADLKTVCNLRLVTFNFSAYPSFTKELMTYAFKPILIAEIYRQYSAFWVIDASARFLDIHKMYEFYDKVREGVVDPFSAEHPSGHTIGSKTIEGMYKYLPLPTKQRDNGMNQALTMFVVRSPIAKDIVRWNLLCALEKECIAPKGATVACMLGDKKCHRFDQSSVSIILCISRLRRGLSCLPATATTGAYSEFFGVARESSFFGALQKC